MSFYLDTPLLVAALTRETRTGDMQAWLAAQEAGSCVISDWVVTEFSSALSIKLRTGQLALPDRAASLAMFTRLAADSFATLPISPTIFRMAARYADQFALGLHAGDALHLAICADHGATLCTLDRKLAEAGAAIGVAVLQP